MDISTWIGLTILAAVIFLLGYMRKASLSHSKKLSKLFNKINREHQLQITEMVSWDTGIIGIDAEKEKIVMVRENYYEIDHSVIEIKDIEACEVLHERLPNMTKIMLVFILKDKNVPSASICFYNSATDIMANMAELKEKAQIAEEVIFKLIDQGKTKTLLK